MKIAFSVYETVSYQVEGEGETLEDCARAAGIAFGFGPDKYRCSIDDRNACANSTEHDSFGEDVTEAFDDGVQASYQTPAPAAPDPVEALRGLFEHCSMIHNRWGEDCNRKEADAAIAYARSVLDNQASNAVQSCTN